ncbi:MAG: SDR family oxidoreductase [Vulcanimicrobiaceae bacterium]
MARDRVAFVTGTSTGFGHLIASGLRADGYAVYATMRHTADRNREPREALERQGIVVLDVDVTDQASVDAAAHAVLKDGGRIDIVVNNAGTAHMGVTEAFTPEAMERQFATNVMGSARVARAFLPAMREAGEGLVVFISSVVGRFVLPFTGVYAGSKFAIEAYAESLSFELRPAGVDIAIVEPGAYATNIFSAMIAPDDTARVQAYGKTNDYFAALGEAMGSSAGDPQEVATAIRALAKAPGGTRPLRVVVPADAPAAAINAAVAPIQHGIIEAFGMSALNRRQPTPA